MRKPIFITFTGVDENTSIPLLDEISSMYPVEWGILFSPARQGQDPRYPAPEVIRRVLDESNGSAFAAHLCGGYSRCVMKGGMPDLPIDITRFGRVQVNSREPVVEKIAEFQGKYGVSCIAQARGSSFPDDASISWLFDQSGGHGEAPAVWPVHPGRTVGYAGGINPSNVKDVVAAIGATGPYWIDMESGVRTDNYLDLGLCTEVCRAVYG